MREREREKREREKREKEKGREREKTITARTFALAPSIEKMDYIANRIYLRHQAQGEEIWPEQKFRTEMRVCLCRREIMILGISRT